MAQRRAKGTVPLAWGALLLLAPTLVILLSSLSLPENGQANQADDGSTAAAAAVGAMAAWQQQQQRQQAQLRVDDDDATSQQEDENEEQQPYGESSCAFCPACLDPPSQLALHSPPGMADAGEGDPGGLHAAAAEAAINRREKQVDAAAVQAAASQQQQQQQGKAHTAGGGGQIAEQLAQQRQQQHEQQQTRGGSGSQQEPKRQREQPKRSPGGPFREIVVQPRYTGPLPRWPSTLLKGTGPSRPRPGCADKDKAAQCAVWAKRGDCDSNPAYMYHRCAAACGICSAVYLHGNETRPEVREELGWMGVVPAPQFRHCRCLHGRRPAPYQR